MRKKKLTSICQTKKSYPKASKRCESLKERGYKMEEAFLKKQKSAFIFTF